MIRNPSDLSLDGFLHVWIPVKDARLDGWAPLEILASPGSLVRLAGAVLSEREVAGAFKESCLICDVEITPPDGATYNVKHVITRPRRVQIWSLQLLHEYFESLLAKYGKDEIGHAIYNGAGGTFRHMDGPSLNSTQLLAVKGASQYLALYGGSDDDLAEDLHISRGEFQNAMEWAFNAGRAVAEGEIRSRLQRSRATSASRRRVEAARSWWPEGQNWARELLAEWPLGKRKTLAALAVRMLDGWNAGPLNKLTAPPTARHLETKILPKWKAAGAISLEDHT